MRVSPQRAAGKSPSGRGPDDLAHLSAVAAASRGSEKFKAPGAEAGDSGSRAQRADIDLSATNLPEARRKVFSSGFVCNSRLRTLSTDVKGTGDFIDEPPSVAQGGKGVVVPGAALRLRTALNQGRALSAAIVGQNKGQQLVDRIRTTEWPSNLVAGTEVLKRGATTRVTSGRLISAMTTLQWAGVPPNCYLMEQSEIAGGSGNPDGLFAKSGDSGSLVVLKGTPSTAVGLLWGMRGGGRVGLISAIRNVESQLSINTAWV